MFWDAFLCICIWTMCILNLLQLIRSIKDDRKYKSQQESKGGVV